ETREYFGVDPEKIEVLVHPQSMIHALVGFNDGALMAHVGPADMRHAIGYALNWPERKSVPVERLDLAKIGKFEFRDPDEQRWPALRLAREVMEVGGLSGAVFNAAKEAALDGFIAGQIGFLQMSELVEEVLAQVSADSGLIHAAITLDNVRAADQVARQTASRIIETGA
ncbi:MAG: 1-deoxy-D-xylulose-5-phosphate reductoisomerase, partial [Maritimibacter sp.]